MGYMKTKGTIMKIELTLEQLKTIYTSAYTDGVTAKITCGNLNKIDAYNFPIERLCTALLSIKTKLPYAFTKGNL